MCPLQIDILAVKKVVERYEEVAGAKINFGQRKVCARVLGGVASACQGHSAGVTDPSASSGCG